MEINMIAIPRATLVTAMRITVEERLAFDKEKILLDMNVAAFIFFLSLQN
jgi:hypothetical protein